VVFLFGYGAVWLGLCATSAGAGEMGRAVSLSPVGFFCIGGAIHRIWFRPYIVTSTDKAAILEARARKIVIPWGELYSVGLSSTRRGSYLRWAYGRGKVARLPAKFNGLTTMLTEIRRRPGHGPARTSR